ncbi:hypothetical protein RugamoR64_27160 [Duganella rhizosphaerae]
MQDIPQTVYAIVPAPIGKEQGKFVVDPDKTSGVTSGRHIEAVRSACCQEGKRRRLDEFSIVRMNVSHFFFYRRCGWHSVNPFKRSDIRNDLSVKLDQALLPMLIDGLLRSQETSGDRY